MKKQTQTVKIPLKPKLSFAGRERIINTEIQKITDAYNKIGLIKESHEILNKTDSYAIIKFVLLKMTRI
jgi:hypothetical protein